jgi:hypothetical protein
MTPKEWDAVVACVEVLQRFVKLYAYQFEGLKLLLLEKGLITVDEYDEAVKEFEAAIAVDEAVEPDFQALERLRQRLEEQK